MSKILILIAILLTGCSKPIGFKEPAANQELTDSISSIIFDSAKKTDQNAAEVFDLGSVGSSPIKKVFNISNTTGSNIALNFADLQAKVSATTRFSLNLATATPCPASLKTKKSCSFDLTLSKVSNESYDEIATNIIDAASRGANPEFGGMLFSGVKTNDVSSEVPLAAIMRIDRLADSYQIPAGSSVTKRFYIGNIGSTVLKTPGIVAPQDGVVLVNSCLSLVSIKPNGTCFFEIKYTSDLSPEKSNYNTSITFTSTDPLVNTTGLKIDLSITNQPAVVPVVNANFNQVGSITDLSTSNGRTRLYVNNTGSSALDTATIVIPSQYTVSGTSCPASLKTGKTCFYDLTINTAQTANSSAVIAPITIGTTTFAIKAGDPAIVNSPNPVSSCKAGFSMINGSCISSNVSQSCSANGGSGTQQSIDGGQSFGSCQLTTCSDNRYVVSSDQLTCNPISCTIGNANINQATAVSGDLISGCIATACSSTYSVVGGICQLAVTPPIGDLNITISAGGSVSCNLQNGMVYCAGFNIYGAMGNGLEENVKYSTPQLVNIPETVTQVVTGSSSVCALLSNKTVKCWGDNYWGNLGLNQNQNHISTPTLVPNLTNVKALTMTDVITCALMESGSVACTGLNVVGTIGDGSTINRSIFTPVVGISSAIQVSIKSYTACALLSDFTVQCWGNNQGSSAGTSIFGVASNITPNYVTPVAISGLSNIKDMHVIDGYNICVIKADGTARCKGTINQDYSLLNNISITQIIASNNMVCLLGSDGIVKCNGSYQNGQLGNGLTSGSTWSYITPTGLPGNIASMSHAIGQSRTLVKTTSGVVYGFGLSEHGAMGIPSIGTAGVLVPTPMITDF